MDDSNKKCFIITQIGSEESSTFRKAKGVIESVIKPVLQKYNFMDIKPSYEIMESGMIGNQIIDRIINDDLVVANLTGNNPNVMYELAIRHATAKPIIHICEKGTILPFDIKDSRTIFYTDDMYGTQELKTDFEKFVGNMDLYRYYKNNPIHNKYNLQILTEKSSNLQLFDNVLIPRISLQEKISKAKKSVYISGTSLISICATDFDDCIDNGIEVNLLMSSNNEELIKKCAELSYADNIQLRKHIETTLEHLKKMSNRSKINIKSIDIVMPVGLVGIDINESYGMIYIQQYLYNSDPSKAPRYVCLNGEKSFRIYYEQIKRMWERGEIIRFDDEI